MRRVIALMVLLGVLGSVIGVLGAGSSETRVASGPLVVHEWGTFTSFAGSDGVQLEFRPLVDNDLPGFVFDRARQAGYVRSLGKAAFLGFQRMETPVTYFYTDRPREVEVSVGFPRGLLTEFFPPVKEMAPAFDPNKLAVAKNSRLDWGRVRLLPPGEFAAMQRAAAAAGKNVPQLPQASGKDHYAFARETDAAIVAAAGHKLAKGTQYEKFLFYRGIGNFRLPLKLEALSDGEFLLHNQGPDAVRSLFLVDVRDGVIRLGQYDRIAAWSTLPMRLPCKSVTTVEHLGDAVVQKLVAEGLYEKEARAMVKTWKASWFGEEGARLFYVVPERIVEEMIPLQVKPRPAETVRVLVGRLEVLTPDREVQLTTALQQLVEKKDDEEVAAAKVEVYKMLQPLGRFAEPALQRIVRTSQDPAVKAVAEELTKERKRLREYHTHATTNR